jgi:hypothetical protein
MKKSILSLLTVFLLAGTISTAQYITIKDIALNTVASGSTVQVSGPLDETIHSYFNIQNTGTDTLRIKVRKIENSLVPGSGNLFCFNGNCYTTPVSGNILTLAPGQITDNSNFFYGDYDATGNSGMSSITYVFFNYDNSNDSSYVIVQYNGTAGIPDPQKAESMISSPYPNPANNGTSFKYNLGSTYPKASIQIFDLLYTKVAEVRLENISGTAYLNTSDLNSGVYFYSLVINDKALFARKLVIQR